MPDREIQADLVGEDRMSPALDSAAQSTEVLGGKMGRLKGAMALGAGALMSFGVALAGVVPNIVDQAVKLEAMDNKARTVFGKDFPAMEEEAKNLAGSLGITKTSVENVLAGFGDLLIPMGFSTSKAADLTKNMGFMTAALTQWSGGTMEATDVADILSDSLMGEYDSLKSLGVQMSADLMTQKLHAAGKDQLTGKALQQAQVEITLKEIMEQSTSAIDSYSKGTNKLGLAKNKLSTTVGELKDKLILGLTPAISQAFDWVNKMLPAMSKWWKEHKPTNEQLKLLASGLFVAKNNLKGVYDGVMFVVNRAGPAFRMIIGNLRAAMDDMKKSGIDWNQILGVTGTILKVVAGIITVTVIASLVAMSAAIRVGAAAWDNVFRPAIQEGLRHLGNMLEAMRAFAGVMAKLPGPAGAPFREMLGPLDAAIRKVNELKGALDRVPETKTVKVWVYENGALKSTDAIANNANQRESRGVATYRTAGKARALGGPVSAGTSYLVGEYGAEMFTPTVSGRIVPGGGGGIVVNVSAGQAVSTAADIAAAVTSAIATARRTGWVGAI